MIFIGDQRRLACACEAGSPLILSRRQRPRRGQPEIGKDVSRPNFCRETYLGISAGPPPADRRYRLERSVSVHARVTGDGAALAPAYCKIVAWCGLTNS